MPDNAKQLPQTWRISRDRDMLSVASFTVLGLPDGILGPAWPSMRQSLAAPIADLGLILLLMMVGSVTVSIIIGPIIRRFGVPLILAWSGSLAAVGGTAYALANSLWFVFLGTVFIGAAASMMDAAINTMAGLSGRSRLLNLLHAGYGVGTTVGPLLVTVAIMISTWRAAYATLAALDFAIAVAWFSQRRSQSNEPGQTPAVGAGESMPPRSGDTWSRGRSLLVIAAGMAMFFVYTGLEVAAGQWEASFCRGHLHTSASVAGYATSGYWAALTAVRIILAVLPRSAPPVHIVRWGSGIAILASATIWWQPGTFLTLVGFILLGAALAGIYPALVALTPLRTGTARAADVIAWQLGAAAAGGSVISALTGLLIGLTSLSVLGPVLTSVALVMGGIAFAVERIAPTSWPMIPMA